jgi:hypothetical protein
MRVFGRVCLIAGGAMLVAASAHAQYPQRHQGVYATFGLGYGSAKVACDQCGDTSRTGDLTGFLNVGGALSQSILLGGEVTGWSKVTDSNDNLSTGTANAVISWYPSTREGFFIKGGLGFGFIRGDKDTGQGGIKAFDSSGIGYQLGLGYDMRIQRNLSVTAVANFYGGNVGDIGTIRNVSFNVIQFMAAVTFH